MRSRPKSALLSTKPSAGEVLDNDYVLELVQVSDAPELQFLVWNGHEPRFARSFMYGHLEYVPIQIAPSVVAAINFPSTIADYESARGLVEEISTLIMRVGHLGSDDAERLAFFVIATWLTDVLPVAPFLWLVMPRVAPRAPLLRLLTQLCRRSLRLGDLTLAAMQSLPLNLYPTLISETSGMSRALSQVLRVSSNRGTFSVAGGELREFYSAKVLVADRGFELASCSDMPLEVSGIPTGKPSSVTDIADIALRADLLTAKLLKLRLERLAEVRSLKLEFSEFTPALQTLLPTLAAAVWNDEHLRSRIVSLFEERDRELRAETADRIEALLAEALLAACHTAGAQQWPVFEITKQVNTIIKERGGATEFSPEKIGWELRALGIRTVSLSDGRKGVELLENVRRRIHELALEWETRTWNFGALPKDCAYCAAAKSAAQKVVGSEDLRNFSWRNNNEACLLCFVRNGPRITKSRLSVGRVR